MRWLFCNKVETVLFITVNVQMKKWPVEKKIVKKLNTQSEMQRDMMEN